MGTDTGDIFSWRQKPTELLPQDRGLGIPLSSDERRSHESFDQETFDVYLHEFQHLAATIGVFNDIDTGLKYVKLVTAQPSPTSRGEIVISNVVSQKSLGLIAAAGMTDPPEAVAIRYGDDQLKVEQVSHELFGSRDVEVLKREAYDLLERSPLSPELRTKLAEMATIAQRRHNFPVITATMLRTFVRQAEAEIRKVEEDDDDGVLYPLFDHIKLNDYKAEADEIAKKYRDKGAEGLYGYAIATEFTREEGTHMCEVCGSELSGPMAQCATCQSE